MKINKTKILLYTEEKGILEYPVANYAINMVSGDNLVIVGTFECEGETVIPTSLRELSTVDLIALLHSHNLVVDFLNGNITKRKFRKMQKQLGVLHDYIPTPRQPYP